MINSVFRRLIKFSGSFALSFLEFLPFLHYLVAKLLLNHYKVSPCVFNFSFFYHHFVYQSSSWMPYMMVHRGFISFSKRSSTFFSKELNHSSFCNPECNSFYRIIGGGIMSFLIIWVHVSWFTKLSRMMYFKSINLLIGVILGYIPPKAFPKDCC